jgi:hypothetical protein
MSSYRQAREFIDSGHPDKEGTVTKYKVKELYAIPKPKNRLLAIILKNNKSTAWKWVDRSKEYFSHDQNTYFIDSSGTYLSSNRVLCSMYIEGISTPISHKNIVITEEIVEFENPITGEKEETTIRLINDLKIDSKVVDICLNRHLADEFTRTSLDKKGIAMFLLLIAIMGFSAIGAAMHFA